MVCTKSSRRTSEPRSTTDPVYLCDFGFTGDLTVKISTRPEKPSARMQIGTMRGAVATVL